MSSLYDIYVHPSGIAWGVSVEGGAINTAELKDGKVLTSTLQPFKLAAEVTKRLRSGYSKAPRAKYLLVTDTQDGKHVASFVDRHPELCSKDDSVLFAVPGFSDDKAEIADMFEKLLDKTSISDDVLSRWLTDLRNARQYFVAPKTHPALSLVLADWAIEYKKVLMASSEGIPIKRPKDAPGDWEAWLSKSFEIKEVRDALTHLGWSTADLLFGSRVETPNMNVVEEGSERTVVTTYSF